MESEEILDLQFTGSWSTCFPIPGSDFLSPQSLEAISYHPNPWKRFPITFTGQPAPQSLEAISYHLSYHPIPGSDFLSPIPGSDFLSPHPQFSVHWSTCSSIPGSDFLSPFINEYRIREAQRLLLENTGKKLSILDIAFESGFNCKTSFNTVFKKHLQMTPTHFRQTNRLAVRGA
jgi:hypothetical protein